MDGTSVQSFVICVTPLQVHCNDTKRYVECYDGELAKVERGKRLLMIYRSRSLGATSKSGEADLKSGGYGIGPRGGAAQAGGGGSSFTKGVGQKVVDHDKTLLCGRGTTAPRAWSGLGPDETKSSLKQLVAAG